nr:MAG TPA: chitin synthase regulator [Caudoviricetes sp.]
MQNFKIEFENIKNKLPVIIRRLLFSIPTVIIIAFVTLLLCFAEKTRISNVLRKCSQ